VGQVGRARSAATNATQLFLHSQPGAAYGSPEPLYAAFQQAAAAVGSNYKLSLANASASNPGLPPSSLHVLLRWKPALQALFLGEFDSSYSNPYYQSRCGPRRLAGRLRRLQQPG
jgi:nicastrin